MSPQLQATQVDQPAQQNHLSEIKEPVQSIQDQPAQSVKKSGDRSRSTTSSAYQPSYKRQRKIGPASRRVQQLLEASREDSRMVVNAMEEMSQSILKGFRDIIKNVVNNPMSQFQTQHGFSQPFTNVSAMTSMMNMPVSQHVASETQCTTTSSSYFDLLSKSSDLVD